MTATITLKHTYQTPPDAVWRVATEWSCLVEAMRGLATFRGLPSEPLHAGQVIACQVSLLGVLPWQPWRMELLKFSPQDHRFETHESGGMITRWDHTLTVAATDVGSELSDTVEIEAGWLTPFASRWAKHMYARRHGPRKAMLSEIDAP